MRRLIGRRGRKMIGSIRGGLAAAVAFFVCLPLGFVREGSSRVWTGVCTVFEKWSVGEPDKKSQ